VCVDISGIQKWVASVNEMKRRACVRTFENT
jgi:hypothetical protein